MNNVIVKENIENLIYEIRGKQVMLDSDLARLYECMNGTKTINLAVKRHINRFPERFMFQLTKEECDNIPRFQFETLEEGKGHNIKYLPYVFTEQGVAMLATVLRTKVAEEISIRIMDAFVSMKKYISNDLNRISNIEKNIINIHNTLNNHEENIMALNESFKKFDKKRKLNDIYFAGQIYDAFSKVIDIFREAREKLIIVDGYADKVILDCIKDLKCDVLLITKKNCLLSPIQISKYNEQYGNLTVKYDDTFHDRYFIIDNKIFYHCGTSINKIGKRTFSINVLQDSCVCSTLMENINSIK